MENLSFWNSYPTLNDCLPACFVRLSVNCKVLLYSIDGMNSLLPRLRQTANLKCAQTTI